MFKVGQMYKKNAADNTLMLSNYGSDFWKDYRDNHTRYDKVFNRMFNSFYYFLQEDDETIGDVTDNFREDVYNHLLMNDKKYDELYRVQVIPDVDYSLTNNYDMHEVMDKDVSDQQDNTYGQRTDTGEAVYGQRTDTGEAVYGQRTDTGEAVYGQRTDTGEAVYGQRTDTGEAVYGQRTDTGEAVKGQRSDNTTNTTGQQTNSSTESIAPYDSSTFANLNKKEDVLGNRQDTIAFTEGSQTDTSENVKGSQTDTTENVKGSQTDTTENVYGQHKDDLDRTYAEDYTLHRYGNIGVMTVTDMLDRHIKLWSMWDFYEYIFKEICKELLML